MDILDRVRMDLHNNSDSTIYFLDESEKDVYNEIHSLILSEKTNYLDIVLDSEDYKIILGKLRHLDERGLKIFLGDYILNRILEKSGFNVTDDETAWFDLMVRMLNEKCSEDLKIAPRIHFFLDEVYNELLQKKINDLFSSRGLITNGYTTKSILTYSDSHNYFIEDVHDYNSVLSRKKEQSIDRCRKNLD